MKYLFGPVNSRRLGVSLGVDLVPYKTCSLNCVYCECGATESLTSEIKEYVPTSAVIAELEAFLKDAPRLDAVTFSGSGEPTLHEGIGVVIDYLKKNHPYKVAVLTNGTLLNRPEVRQRLLQADTVIPTLNAVTPEIFNKIVRPAEGITPATLIDGILSFRKEFKGRLIIELFIIPGVNDSEGELALLKDVLTEISPDLIQINTLDRPGTEDWISVPGTEDLVKILDQLRPLNVEAVGRAGAEIAANAAAPEPDLQAAIMELVIRRPSTVEDILAGVDSDRVKVAAAVERLLRGGKLIKTPGPRGDFYSPRDRD
jgi:wyosine [tRNA(Phe)-imidazoG37] synthetase (radical SAM superfamily)